MIRFDNLPPEVMQAMCTPMHLILPPSPSPSARTGALFLGSFSAILDPVLLESNKISALVQVLDAPWLPSVDAHAKHGLEAYRLDILDSTSADLKPHLEATVRWIDDRLRKGVNVLVHCQQGVSRSAAVVIAYLIYTHNMSYASAYDLVRRKRACIKPNSSFVRCLQEWEQQWHHAEGRPVMRRASTTPPLIHPYRASTSRVRRMGRGSA